MNIRTMTTEERERLAYAEGFTETANLLGQLDDAERERDQANDENENHLDELVNLKGAIQEALALIASGDTDLAMCLLTEVSQ